MSLPWILCRVERHASISVEFTDDNGDRVLWEDLPTDVSELLQHELDHLDGGKPNRNSRRCSISGYFARAFGVSYFFSLSRLLYPPVPETWGLQSLVRSWPPQY